MTLGCQEAGRLVSVYSLSEPKYYFHHRDTENAEIKSFSMSGDTDMLKTSCHFMARYSNSLSAIFYEIFCIGINQ
jgi:hypothetical protein